MKEIYLKTTLEIIQEYYKTQKENSTCSLINMFKFDQEKDLETSIIRCLINCIANFRFFCIKNFENFFFKSWQK
jgi:hypothetical protein